VTGEPLVRWDWVYAHLGAIADRLGQHLYLAVIAIGVGFVISFGLAALSVRRRRLYPVVTLLATAAYTIPSFALFAGLVAITGLTTVTAEVPLILYTIVLFVPNIVAGFDSVPLDVLDAADGMGYARGERWWRVELPLAVPLVIAGVDHRPRDRLSDPGRQLRRPWVLHPRRLRAPLHDRNPGWRIALDRSGGDCRRGVCAAGAAADSVDNPSPSEPLMDLFAATAQWLADPMHWQGSNGIPARLSEHVALSGASVLVAALVALPLGLWIGHTGRFSWWVVSTANAWRALPSFAVIGLLVPFTTVIDPNLGFTLYPTVVAMIVLAGPPILVNTYQGIVGVDRDLVEAARAMGMRERQILFRVEVPIALPVVATGLRSAAVQVIATATLGATFGFGGLGRFIILGDANQDNGELFGGVVLVAALALATFGLFLLIERRLISRGLSRRTTG
jgi:osmoprotectant transport system permease protein